MSPKNAATERQGAPPVRWYLSRPEVARCNRENGESERAKELKSSIQVVLEPTRGTRQSTCCALQELE
eukprot:4875338-Amphidinium_carterae.1